MIWSKTIKFRNYIIQTSGIFQVYKERVSASEVEKERLSNLLNSTRFNSGPPYKIARIKAYRSLTDSSLVEAKLWVELNFEDNGNGEIKK